MRHPVAVRYGDRSVGRDVDEPGPAPLRVLHVINQLQGHGGAEVSLEELLRHTEGHGLHHAVVLLKAEGNLTGSLEEAGVEVVAPGRNLNRPEGILAVRATIQAFDPHVVHATLFDAGVAGRLAARSCGVPAVVSLVNTAYEPESLRARGARGWRAWLTRRLDRALVGSTARFHALTDAVALSYAHQLGIPPQKIEVIPRGKNDIALGRQSEARRAAARLGLGLHGDEPLVLTVGREEALKGHLDLLEATALLRPAFPALRLVIAGRPGAASASITEAVDRLDLDGVVTRLGARTDVPELLCAADVFAFPSLSEGLGVSVLEAMAMEVPIVASDVPALRELLEGGALAVLVPPHQPQVLADAIRAALSEGRGSARTVAARQRFEQRYRLDLVAERMTRFWSEAAGSG